MGVWRRSLADSPQVCLGGFDRFGKSVDDRKCARRPCVKGWTVAHIRYINDGEATGQLQELYDRFRDPAGQVDNILRIHGANPPSLLAHFQLYHTLMKGASPLSRSQREMIAVVVSAINECHY